MESIVYITLACNWQSILRLATQRSNFKNLDLWSMKLTLLIEWMKTLGGFVKKLLLGFLMFGTLSAIAQSEIGSCGKLGYFVIKDNGESSIQIGTTKFNNLSSEQAKLVLAAATVWPSICLTQKVNGDLKINN